MLIGENNFSVGNCHILLIKIPLLIKIKIKLQVLDDLPVIKMKILKITI